MNIDKILKNNNQKYLFLSFICAILSSFENIYKNIKTTRYNFTFFRKIIEIIFGDISCCI